MLATSYYLNKQNVSTYLAARGHIKYLVCRSKAKMTIVDWRKAIRHMNQISIPFRYTGVYFRWAVQATEICI